MKRCILLLSTLCACVTAMPMEQNEAQISLIAKDSTQVDVPLDIAKKIPAVNALRRLKKRARQQEDIIHVFGDASPDLSNIEAFERGSTLKAITSIIEEVYSHAPILKRDSKFFEKTDAHPAYTPGDIPMQVRNIIYNMESAKRPLLQKLRLFLGLYVYSEQEKAKYNACRQQTF